MKMSHQEVAMEHRKKTGWSMPAHLDLLLLENTQKLDHTILNNG